MNDGGSPGLVGICPIIQKFQPPSPLYSHLPSFSPFLTAYLKSKTSVLSHKPTGIQYVYYARYCASIFNFYSFCTWYTVVISSMGINCLL